SGGSYMLFDGAIYKISKVFPATFKKERKAWFNRKLFDDQIADVKRLAVSAPGVSYALIQKDGEWALEDASVLPEGFRFDSGLARSLVNGVIGTRAKEILEKDPEAASSGLGKDAWTLAYSVGAGASAKVHTLLIGKSDAEKNVYAKSVESDDSLLLPASGAARLQKKIEDFRNLHVMDFDAAKAKELSIRTSKGLLSFVKTEGQWAIGKSFEKAAEGFEFDPSTVARRLGVISSLKADARLDLDTAAAGLLAPRSVITVVQEDGTTVRLITGKEVQTGDKTNVYISGNIDGAVYQVAKARIDQLVGGLESFKKVAPPPGGMGGNPLGNIDPQQLQNLPPEIRQQLIQQLMQQQQGRQTQ
ncbi:DUF4340 domain-containing protein, partial [Myxococcota bacterium]|nr:DUF4340 domain-containing protein [Myxococcota bacterium]